ncbi:hypothetical protein CI109_100138 [Kwoniella shandongensis]|uniref:Exocyst complex protein EXO70 n=1 Tax=Kwoniella shandongensis TaxID=1734106 RepID=A0A5M6BRR3_9TREE|nr:uncharacterized protein CI109_006834 [Kwoniella shandongensis]KAA5524811.1 hypothetical protein CI109_006834 [Kwoniella shandongensis]
MDEEADLALLDQHLLKTNLLGQRMTNILGQLDTRLSRLDKTIAPLGLQPLTRKANNIDAVLLQLDGGSLPPPSTTSTTYNRPLQSSRTPSSSSTTTTTTTANTNVKGYSLDSPISSINQSHFLTKQAPHLGLSSAGGGNLTPIASAPASGTASPADETALLTRGPDIMSLGEYFNALDGVVGDLERMWRGLIEGRGGAREAGVKDLSKLVEIGFSGMVQLFLKISREGTGRTIDVDVLLSSGAPTPPNLFPPLNTLLPLTSKINSLVNPSPNNPTPKTTSIVQPIFDDAIARSSELRGDWMCRSLRSLVSRIEEADEGGIWEGGKGRGKEKVKGIVGLWESVMVLAEAETMLITTLFSSHPPPYLLTQTLVQPLALLNNTISPTLSTLKRALSSHTFIALDLYSSLTALQSSWDEIISHCLESTSTPSTPETKDLQSALNLPVSTLRSLSLRSFPELLVDIRTAKTDGPPSSSIGEVTYSTLGYLETLPEYESVVEGLLGKSHSERSWLMGMKEAPSSVRSAGEEGGIVNLFVADVLGTLMIHLEGRARTMRRPIGQAFLLNNLSHIRNTTSSFNSDIIGPGAEDMLNRAFREAKSQYLHEFQSLVSLLTSTQNNTPRFGVTVPSSEKQHLKDSAQAFFDRLAELEGICGNYPLNRQDPEMRDRVGREVEGIVRGGYEGFWGRCAGKGVEKYLRGSPDDITRRVQAMFR